MLVFSPFEKDAEDLDFLVLFYRREGEHRPWYKILSTKGL